MNGGALGGNWATGRMNRPTCGTQDWLASEGGFIYNDLTARPCGSPGMRARLLGNAGRRQTVVVIAGAMQKPWTYTVLPPADAASPLRRLHGKWCWHLLQPHAHHARPAPDPRIADINAFFTRNVDYYRRTRSEARVALVWSDTTREHL
jgi:hypothetical protein